MEGVNLFYSQKKPMTRGRRIKVPNGIYHLMSRTVNGEKFFGAGEKEQMRKMIGAVAEFSGVEVFTYCIMGNHFHLLARVPDGKDFDHLRETDQKTFDRELVRRYRLLHGASEGKRTSGRAVICSPETPEQIEEALRRGDEVADYLRDRLRARMYDVSEFMKTLKQRISIWYNTTHKRYGPVWCDRFKSVLVEGRQEILLVMAAYIDLNPVRAGLVKDPMKYRFCGYAEALAGNEHLQEGLRQVTGITEQMGDWTIVLAEYRKLLLLVASAARSGKEHLDPIEVRRGLEKGGGKLNRIDLLRHRLTYFVNGLILGSESWVRAQLEQAGGEAMDERLPAKVKGLAALGWTAARRCRS